MGAQTSSSMMVVMLPCSSTRDGSLRRSMPRTSRSQTQRAPPMLSSRSFSKPFGIPFHVTQPNGPVCQNNARVSLKRPPLACTNQTLAQLDLLKNMKEKKYKNDVYLLPKELDEKVARLHLGALGAELTPLAKEQADYIGVKMEGPYKPDTYGY